MERVVTGESSVEAVLGLDVADWVEEVEVKMRLTGSSEKEAKENLLMDGIEIDDCERDAW